MRAAFRVRSSKAARVAMGRGRYKLMEDIVRDAEKLGPGPEDYVMLHVHGLELMAVVELAPRVIHVMTQVEAAKAGIACRCPACTGKKRA